MRIATLVSALALAVTIGPANAIAQPQASDGAAVVDQAPEAVEATAEFATLRHVDAVRMEAAELDAVKGLHVHFQNPAGQIRFAGNPENNGIGIGNWYNNGSPEAEAGHLVAPSYHGLCVAPPIFVSAFGPEGPTLAQCP
jgi:hypothetical protein